MKNVLWQSDKYYYKRVIDGYQPETQKKNYINATWTQVAVDSFKDHKATITNVKKSTTRIIQEPAKNHHTNQKRKIEYQNPRIYCFQNQD